MLELTDQIESIMTTGLEGSVVRVVGLTAAVADFPAPLGALVVIDRQPGEPLEAEVIGFKDELTLLYPWGDVTGVRRGNRVRMKKTVPWLRMGNELLGRVINAHGECIDGKPAPALTHRGALHRSPPNPTDRPRINTPLSTGIKALDGMLTCGRGQRMGIFSGSGVGKSVTLGMMSRYTSADVNVIALIGERGRELNDFIERDLGPEGLAKSVVMVSTSDEPALLRVRAAFAATSIAEYFRDQGKDVLLIMDSLTRFAMAQREIGLAAGEPPTTRGYPPSVFALLPRLVERAGRSLKGSITAFYSVLVENDDPNDPIGDSVRGLIDGHTWLSRKIASRGHYPAIDVLESISRLMSDIIPPKHLEAAMVIRSLMSAYRDNEDLISIGAYRKGSNPLVDAAIEIKDDIDSFLKQKVEEPSSVEKAMERMIQIAEKVKQRKPTLPNNATKSQ